MAGEITVKIDGLEAALKKLDKSLWTEPLRRFWERASIVVQGRARVLAPVDTGRLRASLVYEVDSASPPMYAAVGSDVFYAPYQEFGTVHMQGRHYLQGGFEQSQGDMKTLVDAMGGEIVQAWG